jgi:fatty acid desaturase
VAAFFPTSLSVQRAYHLTHHRNNRTELERFDYVQPGESQWLKRAQWYSILTGLYWLVSVLGLLLYLIAPIVLRRATLRSDASSLARQTASRAYLATLDAIDPVTARLEIVLSFGLQLTMFVAFDLDLFAWLLCYAAFAFQWSSLQYADHAYSPLDIRDGAWNLRVNAFTRALFLNYHYHLAHHRYPFVPWIHLGRFVDPGEPRPSFVRMWLTMWRGPRPLPAGTE